MYMSFYTYSSQYFIIISSTSYSVFKAEEDSLSEQGER